MKRLLKRLLLVVALGVCIVPAHAAPRSESGCERWLDWPFFKKRTRNFLQEVQEGWQGEVDLSLARSTASTGVDIPGAFLVQTELVGPSSPLGPLEAESRIAGTRARPRSSVGWVEEMPDADFAALLVPVRSKGSEEEGFFSSLLSAGMDLLDRVTMGTLFDPVQEEVGDTLADLASEGTEDEAKLRELVEAKKEAIRADAKASRSYDALLVALQEGRLRFFETGAQPSPVTIAIIQDLPARAGVRCSLREEFSVEVELRGKLDPIEALQRAFPLSLQDLAQREPTSARCSCEAR